LSFLLRDEALKPVAIARATSAVAARSPVTFMTVEGVERVLSRLAKDADPGAA